MIDYAKKIIVFTACVAIACAGWYWFGGNNNDRGTESIRADLQRIEAQQRDIVKRLDSITAGLDKSIVIAEGISSKVTEVTGLVESVEGRISASKGRIIDSQLRIETGERIIQGIRIREEKRSP